ncbi:unnamed protein product [Strongylus vulgaris]|uniref:Uncharacterized protein n=1 Tax=Strongylus vulgaris TaxID=40348 RepID=A0A3P7J3Q7_STRVU|nr:unnamed protein product [Strongylus vulgaris]
MLLHVVQNEEDKYLITLVYRFVFANEAICGDPFSDPEWLPAAEECFVSCDPTVHMCMIHTKTSVQKCRLFSQECQAAIRKHLGWSSTIVSIYRPDSTTTIMPAFVTSLPESHADRSAVSAAEDIERDFMGPATLSTVAITADGISSSEAAVSIDLLTSPAQPSPNEWPEAPALVNNEYSLEESQSINTEAPQDGYEVENRKVIFAAMPADHSTEYDGAGLNNNNIGGDAMNTDGDSFQEESDYVPITLTPKRLTMKVLPPGRPQPSPPAFPPYYLMNRYSTPFPAAKTPPKDIVPKYINYLEPPFEDSEDADPYDPLPPPHPPAFRPSGSDDGTDVSREPEPWVRTTTILPLPTLHETPDDNRVEEPEVPIFRGVSEDSRNGVRFEVLPPHSPLRSAVNVGTFDTNLQTLPEQRRIHQYIDLHTRRKVVAEIQPEKARDRSRRCCEWSLNGLCDGHWQRVRIMCAKSCGTLVCEDIEGIKSCTRVVDVDVEDCFQSAKLTRYFGLKNAETEEERRSIIDGIVQQKLGRTKRRKAKKRRL